MDFKAIEKKYKPMQMWAWNEKLISDYTVQHVEEIEKSGFGSFCINAQSGLATRYLGDEWHRNISAAVTQAKECGLCVWVCDEYGSPSGSGNGTINSAGLDFQQKFLRCEAGEATNDRTIIYKDGYHFYYDVNPYYIDVLNKDAAQFFINEAYMPYLDKYSGDIDGIFSNTPDFGSENIPWSFTLPAEYKNAYGEELLDVLPELFRPVGDYKNTRIKFRALISKLFAENFLSPVYAICSERNVFFSSLVQRADDFKSSCSPMAQFMNMHIPTVEAVSREDCSPLPAIMASSVVQQFNKKASTAILFSKAGHAATFFDLRKAASMQFARGITNISYAYETSSLRGIRKRTNSTHSYLHPHMKDIYTDFNEYISRISKALSFGKAVCDTLLLSNQAAVWSSDAEVSSMLEAVSTLEKKHIVFHIGDEFIMEKHAYIEGDTICIGGQRYKTIVLPESSSFLPSTEKLLSEFEHGGGFIAFASSLPSNEVCDNENLLYTVRKCNEYTISFFYNNSGEEFTAAISAGSKMLDIETGEITPFYGVYKFTPYESIIVIDDNSPELPRPFKKPLKTLDISGEWNVEHITPNALVLDKCNVYLNGEIACENINVCDVTELAYSFKTQTDVECRFNFNITTIENPLFLVCENPYDFTIKINDEELEEKEVCATFIDRAFPMIEITRYVKEGNNEISIAAYLSPSDELLNQREIAAGSKSELSRITYDTEFEPVCIVGDFSLEMTGGFRKLDKNAYRYIGSFSIGAQKSQYNISNLEQQGLVFFAGEITLSRTFNLSDTQYAARFLQKGVCAVQFEINGQKLYPQMWQTCELDLSAYLIKGDNEIKITLFPPLRNLLGPHHIPIGELYTVDAGSFYMNPTIWNALTATPWENNYCFIEFGIELE
jgi:hypothetical protein